MKNCNKKSQRDKIYIYIHNMCAMYLFTKYIKK